jgi:hypothetical protein
MCRIPSFSLLLACLACEIFVFRVSGRLNANGNSSVCFQTIFAPPRRVCLTNVQTDCEISASEKNILLVAGSGNLIACFA